MHHVWAVESHRDREVALRRRPHAHPPESKLAVDFEEVLKPGRPSLSARVGGPLLPEHLLSLSVMSVKRVLRGELQ